MILFFPLGVLLMWLYAPWRNRFKWMWTGIAAFLALMVVVGAVSGGGDNKSDEAHTAQGTTVPAGIPTLTADQIASLQALATQQAEQATVAPVVPTAIPAEPTAAPPADTPVPAVAYCPRDGVMAWLNQVTPLINEGTDILNGTTRAAETLSLGSFAPLRDQAVDLRGRAAALYVPPCATTLRNTILEGYDDMVLGLNAAVNGNYTSSAAYFQQVDTIFSVTAQDQLAQLQREIE